MKPVTVTIPSQPAYAYDILIAGGILLQPHGWLPKKRFSQSVIISDETVAHHYAQSLIDALQQQGIRPLSLTFPPGEASKNLMVKQALEAQMFEQACDRETLILALGGGVTGDLAGFIAATYMRGVDYIQLPTSLLAMVDSSVGGKTAINTAYGKNLIGAFYQPKGVVSDIHCLRTLPEVHRIAGWVEAVKMFITHQKNYFEPLQGYTKTRLLSDETLLATVVHQAVSIKAEIVARDQKEKSGERAVCNFGHTIGHAIERLSDYQLLHGIAVALGLLVEIRIAYLMGRLDNEACLDIEAFFKKLGLTGDQLQQFSVDAVIAETRLDKKVRAGQVNYVLLKAIGQVWVHGGNFIHPVEDEIVKEAFEKVITGAFNGR